MKISKRISVLAIILLSTVMLISQSLVNFQGGRIAMSYDGNENDQDDYGAMPIAIAMVAKAGLRDALVHVEHGNCICENKASRSNRMNNLCESALQRFGPFPNCKEYQIMGGEQNAASNNLAAEINASSATNPLWICAAGPMHTVAAGIRKADPGKRQYIIVISHSDWNQNYDRCNNHTDWAEMKNEFSGQGILFIESSQSNTIPGNINKLANQNSSNGGNDFNAPKSKWSWLQNSDDPDERWLFNNNTKSSYDVSDAGMTFFVITGGVDLARTQKLGCETCGTNETEQLFNEPPCQNNSAPAVSLTSPANGSTFLTTDNITFSANASDSDGTVSGVEFFANGVSIGSDNSAPYSISEKLADNVYTITAVATDNCGASTTSTAVSIEVEFVDPCISNVLPTVSITSPANGALFVVGTNVPITANASDANGTVTQVEFLVDGTSIGVDNAAPFAASYTMTAGTHVIEAIATDDCGDTVKSAPVTIDETDDPQQPYAANLVPGVIEAENYDIGGQGIAYNDSDATNKGDAGIRTDEGVDLDNKNGIICIGWCVAGEWTEYKINVQQTGLYTINYSFSTNANNNPKSFSFDIDGSPIGTVNIAGNDPINNVGNNTFETRELGQVNLTAGEHLLRWTAGSNAICFDNVEFVQEVIPCENNVAPTVAIIAPANGAEFEAGQAVTISANASDSDGNVVQVEFFAGSASLGVDNAAPYSISSSFAIGSHTITAVATDDCDATTTSAPITINVVDPCLDNVAPTVSMASPADGAEFVIGASVALSATASDADGSVESVAFFVDDQPSGSTYIMEAGSHTIYAVATDDCGATTTSASITINETTNPQQPYAANLIPGTIEAEEYDLGGQGLAYNDTDAANKGNAGFRTDEGVDLDLRSGLISIGWCAAGEWTEYTLDVQQTGTYTVSYSFATNANNNPKSFSFAMNGTSIGTVNIAGNDPINNVGNSVFETRVLGDINLTAGTNILRWTAGSNAISFDKVIFEYQAPADVTPPTVPTGLTVGTVTETSAGLSWNASTDTESGVAGYRVYQDGQQVADIAGLSTTISGLVCENTYSFTVSAYDNAGNESAQSGAELATTSACAPIGDYIFIGHVTSGNRLGASASGVDTRPASNTDANVQWEEVATDGGYFYLVNVATSQRLNAPTKRTINMVGSGTTGNTAQWRWVAQGGGEYFLQSREWGKFFHIAADGVSDISTKWNTSNPNIVWTITAVPKSTEETILTDNSVNIYPNPASSLITIELGELQDYASIEIYNTTGQLELAKVLSGRLEVIDIEQLNSGMYIVKINNNNNISTKTLIIR